MDNVRAFFDFPIDVEREKRIDAGHTFLAQNLKVPEAFQSPAPETNYPTLRAALQIEEVKILFEKLRAQLELGDIDISYLAGAEAAFVYQLQEKISSYPQMDKRIYPAQIVEDGTMNCTARAALVLELLDEVGISVSQVDVPGKIKHTAHYIMFSDGTLIWLDPALRPDNDLTNQRLSALDLSEGEEGIRRIQDFFRADLSRATLEIELAPNSKIHAMMSWLPKETVHTVTLLDAKTATRQMFLSADGWTHDQNRQLEEAARIYRASIAYRTPNANPYCGYADVLKKLGNQHEAALAYLYASQLDEAQGYACYRLAGLLAEMGMYPQAKHQYEEALIRVGLNGSRSDAHLELAQTSILLGEANQANNHFQNAWEMARLEFERALDLMNRNLNNDKDQKNFQDAKIKIINYHSWIAQSLRQVGQQKLAEQFDGLGKALVKNPMVFKQITSPSIDLSPAVASESNLVAV